MLGNSFKICYLTGTSDSGGKVEFDAYAGSTIVLKATGGDIQRKAPNLRISKIFILKKWQFSSS